MDLTTVRRYCLKKPGAKESYPFGPGTLVMKVGEKIFAIIADEEEPVSISLKCEPELVELLRSTHDAVQPGYHLNKRHWNTVTLDGTIPDQTVFEWIDDSYDLILEGLPRAVREEVQATAERRGKA